MTQEFYPLHLHYFTQYKVIRKPEVIPMILHCTACRAQHIDKGEWETRTHRTHKCEYCGCEWKPANVPTVGVSKI